MLELGRVGSPENEMGRWSHDVNPANWNSEVVLILDLVPALKSKVPLRLE